MDHITTATKVNEANTAPAIKVVREAFKQEAATSVQEQRDMEEADTLMFEAFRRDYMDASHLVV